MRPGNQAALRTAQMHRQRSQQVIQNNMAHQRRVRSVILTLAPQAPKTTSMGFNVVRTFTINESETVDGVMQFELLVDGKLRWTGMGDERSEGLLRIMMEIENEIPESPVD